MSRWLAAVAALAVLAPGLAAAASPPTSQGIQHFFFAPGTTTSCGMALDVPKFGTAAYCQTYPHSESVVLRPTGKLSICHGLKCIGNPPDQVPTLVYGSWLTLGPFRCDSMQAGVKCVVAKTGKGFLISPTRIKRVG
jgi:hypothetical protein